MLAITEIQTTQAVSTTEIQEPAMQSLDLPNLIALLL